MSLEQRREALIRLLDDEHPAVQKVANSALERLDALASFEHLLQELKSDDKGRQVQAVYGMAKISSDRALRILVQCLKHPSADVAGAAVRVLQEFRDPRLVKPFCDVLPEAIPVVQAAIVEGLGQLRDRRAVPVILQVLTRLSSESVEKAIQALGRIGDPAAEQTLIGLLGHENPRLRAAAALAIGNLSPEGE